MLARQLVPWARSFIQSTEARVGLVNQRQSPLFRWKTFPLVIQRMERRWVTRGQSSAQQTLVEHGSARPVERLTHSWVFLFLMRLTERRWVTLARSLEQPTAVTPGSRK